MGDVCELEMHCCCAFCQKRLCAKHWGHSRCPHTEQVTGGGSLVPLSAPPLPPPPNDNDAFPKLELGQPPFRKRRITMKQSVPLPPSLPLVPSPPPTNITPVKQPLPPSLALVPSRPPPKGGWRKCEHPLCKSGNDTLLRLTGSKHGFQHLVDKSLAVCGPCKNQPILVMNEIAGTAGESSPEVKTSKLKVDVDHDLKPLTVKQMETWKSDTTEVIIEAYKHTAANPMRFVTERWHMNVRIAGMFPGSAFKTISDAESAFDALKTPRKAISVAVAAVRRSPEDVQKVANTVPNNRQVGRFKNGMLSYKQKCDLVSWVRLRQGTNVPLTRGEIMGAITEYYKSNTGDQKALATEAMYHDWRDWVRKHVHDPGFRITTSKKAKALRQIEASALSREGADAGFDRLSALLRRRGIADFDKSTSEVFIAEPSRL